MSAFFLFFIIHVFPIFPRSSREGAVKKYYTLECLLFFLKNIGLNHTAYVRKAAVSIWQDMLSDNSQLILACCSQFSI